MLVKTCFHIIVSDGDASHSVDRRCYCDTYHDMRTFFGDVVDVPVVSSTSRSGWEKLRSLQLLRMSPMHRRHVPIDAGKSPSLMMIWKPSLKLVGKNNRFFYIVHSNWSWHDTILTNLEKPQIPPSLIFPKQRLKNLFFKQHSSSSQSASDLHWNLCKEIFEVCLSFLYDRAPLCLV